MNPEPAPGVASLLERLDKQDRIELPPLRRQELVALGGLAYPFVGADEINWWTGMDEAGRAAARRAGSASLAARRLVTRVGDEAFMTSELTVLTALRSGPAVAALASERGRGHAGMVRVYVGADEDGTIAAVLLERHAQDAGSIFRLSTPGAAATDLGRWLGSPTAHGGSVSGVLGGEPDLARIFDVFHPHSQAPLAYRIEVQITPTGIEMREGMPAGHMSAWMRCGESELEGVVARSLVPLRPPGE